MGRPTDRCKVSSTSPFSCSMSARAHNVTPTHCESHFSQNKSAAKSHEVNEANGIPDVGCCIAATEEYDAYYLDVRGRLDKLLLERCKMNADHLNPTSVNVPARPHGAGTHSASVRLGQDPAT